MHNTATREEQLHDSLQPIGAAWQQKSNDWLSMVMIYYNLLIEHQGQIL